MQHEHGGGGELLLDDDVLGSESLGEHLEHGGGRDAVVVVGGSGGARGAGALAHLEKLEELAAWEAMHAVVADGGGEHGLVLPATDGRDVLAELACGFGAGEQRVGCRGDRGDFESIAGGRRGRCF
jgi:hypothetical protein